MKTIQRVGVAVLLGLTTLQTFAIEGLQISVQCSNVCLTWPSIEGKNYIVQYRQTLNPSDTWQTLTSAWPAVAGTNFTSFVHSNVVQNPSCGCGGTSFAAMGSSGNRLSAARSVAEIMPPVPMAIPVNGSGGGVPLALYPPGFDLSGFLIYDPATGETLSGAGYTVTASSPLTARLSGDGSSPTPMGGPVPDGGSGDIVSEPETGFYQVVQDGVQILNSALASLTNGPISNSVTIGFEAGNADPNNGTNLLGSPLQEVIVMVDGTRYRGADPLIAPGIRGAFNFDTSFLENGDHTVQVVASWLNPDLTDPNNHFFSRYSDPFTLSVSNVIYYPDWDDEIGELGFAYYSFETTCTNSTWQIDIYDISNNLAKTLTGNTGDGFVETNWDLVDLNGVTRATNDADYLFTATITVGDPTTKKTPPKSKPFAYPSQGQWVITYQNMFGNMVNSNAEYEADYEFGGIGAANGGAVTVFPTPGHPEYGQTFPLRYPYKNITTPPTGLQIIADEKALMSMLTNSINRNFYYQGHASGESIDSIDSQRIQIELGSRHYYRFVFLNGCSSATGSLPAAFGINLNAPQQISYFQKHGQRPRTFLGYNKIVYFADTGDFIDPSTGQHLPAKIPDCIHYFLTNLEFYWYFNYDISSSIYNAENDLPELRYGWADGPDLNLYGYEWLHINEFNYQSDWTN